MVVEQLERTAAYVAGDVYELLWKSTSHRERIQWKKMVGHAEILGGVLL